MIKKLSFLLIIGLFIASCGEEEVKKEEPKDLEGLQTALKDEKVKLKKVEAKIEILQDKIEKLKPRELKKKLITTTTPKIKTLTRYIDIQGSIQTENTVNASSEMGGRITQLNTTEGQYVKKGDLIAKLDLESIRKGMDELRKSLELATTMFERQSNLWKQNIGSEMQYLQAKNNKEQLEQKLSSLQFEMTKGDVFAPISGIVDMEFAKQGEVVGPGQPILQLLNTSKVKVVADVAETYLKSVRKGDRMMVEFPALELERAGNINLIGRKIDPANRTFKIEIDMNNSSGMLKPNLLAMLKIKEFEAKNAVVIPLPLLQQEVNGNEFVYAVNDDTDTPTAKKIYVEKGEYADGEVIILKGLKGDEKLVLDGARGLVEGELLIFPEDKTEE